MPNTTNSFEIASDEIQEIIGQVPSWIIRWGISVLFSMLAIVLFVSSYITYPSTILAKTEIMSRERPTRVDWFNEKALNYIELVHPGQKINVGDSLLIEVNTDTKQKKVIFSPTEGFVSLTRGDSLNGNVHIIWITPQAKSFTATLKVPIKNAGKVKAGQVVKITFEEYPSNDFGFVFGKVIDVIPIAMEGTYRVNVKLDNELITNIGQKIPPRPNYFGNAEIILDKTSVFKRIFKGLV